MEFSGACWVLMFVYGFLRVSAGLSGFVRVCPGLSGFVWVCPGLVAQRVLWKRVHPGTSMWLQGTFPLSKVPKGYSGCACSSEGTLPTALRVLCLHTHAAISM